MDLGNGRSGRGVEEKSSAPLVYTLPYSNEEILLLDHPEGEYVGVVYHPQKMEPPLPWRSTCSHCVSGKQKGMDLATKRSVNVLCTRQVNGDSELYRIPTNGEPSDLWCVRDGAELLCTVIQDGQDAVQALWSNGKFIGKTPPPLLQSKIVNRTVRMLASVRVASTSEVRACLMLLLAQQRKDGLATHRRHPCLKIDWDALMSIKW
jgi:hypothetical protein